MPPAHRPAARHRCSAGAGHDAQPDRARVCWTTTTSATTRSVSTPCWSDAQQWTPQRVAASLRHRRRAVVDALAREFGTLAPAGASASTTACSAFAAAANAARSSRACRHWSAPGAIRPAACCCRASGTSRSTGRPCSARPGAGRPAGTSPRTINMIDYRRCPARKPDSAADRGAHRLQLQSGRGGAGQRKVIEGFAREDLFTVVLEHFRTDTADYADILLPATTQLEHVDIHTSYGHLYMSGEQRGHRAAGRSQAEHRNLSPAGRGAWASTSRASRQR